MNCVSFGTDELGHSILATDKNGQSNKQFKEKRHHLDYCALADSSGKFTKEDDADEVYLAEVKDNSMTNLSENIAIVSTDASRSRYFMSKFHTNNNTANKEYSSDFPSTGLQDVDNLGEWCCDYDGSILSFFMN